MPPEAAQALDVLALCDRFHCLPSQVLGEDAWVFGALEIERRLRAADE